MSRTLAFAGSFTLAAAVALTSAPALLAAPKVILISLDSANPTTLKGYFDSNVLNPRTGLGLLRAQGVFADQNVTITPSVTAAAHIAIATGSTAVNNDIPANSFHLVASKLGQSISGFGAPIGGYVINPYTPPATAPNPDPATETSNPPLTAVPLWQSLLAAGKTVVTATWPGGDGVDVVDPGTGRLIQPASRRTVTYTVPFGAFAGVGGRGFTLNAAGFGPATPETLAGLAAAGRVSYSPVVQTGVGSVPVLETFTTGGVTYTINVAALDTTNDSVTNYDTLVFFDTANGIKAGPFALPATGPAYAKVGGPSAKFYLEGSSNKAGTAFFTSFIAPDLSVVRFVRYSANFIPRPTSSTSAQVLANVDDVNNNVGFWAPQPDFRFPERLVTGLTDFPDPELEAIYEDQVRTFTEYQTQLSLRAISQNSNADLVMLYFEQPDGSGHQFTLTDARQASNFLDPTSIGRPGVPAGATGQERQKVARYNRYREVSYREANKAVQEIIRSVGRQKDGTPNSNIIVVSDHGMAPFHTAVSINNLLTTAGISTANLTIRTTGPAVNIYVNLQGRENGGTIDATTYRNLVNQIATALTNAEDPNPNFNYSLTNKKLFKKVAVRPVTNPDGFGTSADIGQDSGDIFAILDLGYNFDGTQSPGVARLGDPAYNSSTSVLSVPNFYGAHGYDSNLPEMSAVFVAAGPNIKKGVTVPQVRNIDVAPTILQILGVPAAATVNGTALTNILR